MEKLEAYSKSKVEVGSQVLVMPYLLQGHLNPIVQFSKRLASKGLTVTLVIPSLTSRFSIDYTAISNNIRVERISNGIEEGEDLSIDTRIKRVQSTVPKTLSRLIQRLFKSDNFPPKVLVYDAFMTTWAMDVAFEHGLHPAPFFTQSCAVNCVYYLTRSGNLEIPLCAKFVDSAVPLRLLENSDLPSTVADRDMDHLYPALCKLIVDQFSNFQKASWLFVNSFLHIEEEVVNWMRFQLSCPMLMVGPTIPSVYLDNRLKDDTDYGLSLFKMDGDQAVDHMKWLDSKEPGSVIYVSLGSLAVLGEKQMEELAWGLKNSNHHFLWVVRESEKTKLPVNFLDKKAENKGLVVSWCSQLQVLGHRAIGCFVTHCGWNSTLESLSLGVPMVAMPQWTDQPTNAKFIVDVWKVGIRVKVDGKGIGRREEIEVCVREIMSQGDQGKEIKKNSLKMRELAKQAVEEGGSSDKDIDQFVAALLSP